MKSNSKSLLPLLAATVLIGAGCGDNGAKPDGTAATTTGGDKPAATAASIEIDGSGTVYPVTSAAAEEFGKKNPGVVIKVSKAGSGAGMKKFLAGEIQICDMSRVIEAKEVDEAKGKGIEVVEVPLAWDGLSVIVNPKNTFAKTMTTAELKKIWEPDSKVKMWSDVRPSWPKKPIKLYGPTTAHGTFEYFTEAIVKKKKASRSDYEQCSDYNTLITGVGSDENALGYIGFAYVAENKDKVQLVGVDDGKGAVLPTPETIGNGSYAPLSRPLAIYFTKKILEQKEVKDFITYLLSDGKSVIKDSGYIPFSDDIYTKILARINAGTTGSVLNTMKPGAKLEDLLK